MPELLRLGADDERDPNFDCGNDDLNEFFFDDSRNVCGQLIAVTYAWIEDGRTLAFFSVSNDAISRKIDKQSYNRAARGVPNTKRFTTLPAVKIGRLAVDKSEQGNGIGSMLITFIKGWFISGNKTGCRFVVVDALNNKKTIDFYKKNQFKFLTPKDENDPTRLMFFDLITVS